MDLHSLTALQAEFLLFECLQDITGGRTVFYIAVHCYIMDITEESNRTSRLGRAHIIDTSFLDVMKI